jgi:iron complex outermembrane receptor protein
LSVNSNKIIERELVAMNKLLISIVIWGTCQASFSQESLDNHSYNDFSWEEEALFGQELPMVLTASRLKQPKAEVPASVTIITAEKN